ncbi:MAG: beta-glucosidase, partial [Chitinophagaceae bacterium]|nr:beta-glucosidase [Chitinophagaceae bacterium]
MPCFLLVAACGKDSAPAPDPAPPASSSFSLNALKINGSFNGFTYFNINRSPVLKFSFLAPLDQSTVATSFALKDKSGATINYTVSFENGDSTFVIQPTGLLNAITKHTASVSTALKSKSGGNLLFRAEVNFTTQIDSSRKFPALSDNALLDLVQQQTFKYFWDFGHPVSGLARERNNGDNNLVTSGGSGFGLMAIITAIHRGFITREQGLARMQTIVGFLKNTAQTFHGAYPHWLNGSTGVAIPFGTKDNGADLVETSYLVQGLLTCRQYFNGLGITETGLRNDINTICNRVEWNWFRNNNQNTLFWHWSPNYNWEMNMQIRGWNECLITYVLAASSTTFGIPRAVFDNGWKGAPGYVNGNNYYGFQLPLGTPLGGPLFFSHYSFLGINPNGLNDASANYATQTTNHTLVNYNYCKANPKGYYGYSDSIWGLTASDIEGGYTASSPTNDVSV